MTQERLDNFNSLKCPSVVSSGIETILNFRLKIQWSWHWIICICFTFHYVLLHQSLTQHKICHREPSIVNTKPRLSCVWFATTICDFFVSLLFQWKYSHVCDFCFCDLWLGFATANFFASLPQKIACSCDF